jgi:hypothetical protein
MGHRNMNTNGTPGVTRNPRRTGAAGENQDAAEASLQARYGDRFRNASYYSTGRDWSDYAPAYRYGETAFKRYRGKRFEDVERALEEAWAGAKSSSRLLWVEARGAVLDAWQAASEDDIPEHPGSSSPN